MVLENAVGMTFEAIAVELAYSSKPPGTLRMKGSGRLLRSMIRAGYFRLPRGGSVVVVGSTTVVVVVVVVDACVLLASPVLAARADEQPASTSISAVAAVAAALAERRHERVPDG
jgi:hypothetical protein